MHFAVGIQQAKQARTLNAQSSSAAFTGWGLAVVLGEDGRDALARSRFLSCDSPARLAGRVAQGYPLRSVNDKQTTLTQTGGER